MSEIKNIPAIYNGCPNDSGSGSGPVYNCDGCDNSATLEQFILSYVKLANTTLCPECYSDAKAGVDSLYENYRKDNK